MTTTAPAGSEIEPVETTERPAAKPIAAVITTAAVADKAPFTVKSESAKRKAPNRDGQIAVLISGKDAKIYVRQILHHCSKRP